MKILGKILGILLFTIVLLGGSGFVLFQYFASAVDKETSLVKDISINEGEGLGVIAQRLQDEGIVKSALFLKIYSRLSGNAMQYKTGEYQLSPSMKVSEVESILVEGVRMLVRITFPEGWTIRQYAELLQEKNITVSSDFITASLSENILNKYDISGDSVEGFLYPDTYFFEENYPAEKVVDYLVSTFFENLEEIYPDYVSLSSEDLYEKIILASIVEREYFVEEEAPLMASVFLNRIQLGYKLQSCATVGYTISEIQGKPYPSRLFYEDLEIESPFNTYVYYGFPPAPIASVGRVALEAAFYPSDTDYLYFVRLPDQTGKHVFSTNYRDHTLAAIEYRLKLDGDS